MSEPERNLQNKINQSFTLFANQVKLGCFFPKNFGKGVHDGSLFCNIPFLLTSFVNVFFKVYFLDFASHI